MTAQPVAVASGTKSATPTAVPTWAAELSRPEATPRKAGSAASVPAWVEATDAVLGRRLSAEGEKELSHGRPPKTQRYVTCRAARRRS